MSTTPREDRKAFTMSTSDNFFDANSDIKVSDATPDSGVHDLSGMDPEEKARREAEWREELARVEEEIQSLRTVLASKLVRSQELKRNLGITVWKELKDDMEQGIKNIQDSAAYKDVSGKLVEWNSALTSAPIYQKTTSTFKTAGEKTTTALGTLGASVSKKLGEMKNSTAFKSVEEKVGNVYSNVKSKVSSRSSSVNSFEEIVDNRTGNSVSATPTTSPVSEEKPLS
ncbi:tumor protein D54 isoform X1 [Ixodes scapularis]|uniref:tumor protein D54 isoform X1 n=1 Tax=Ixodes scapularis TaxID=6945 RepID=UPI0011617764|nr:tumor protein D54 isoform X1 [Ixodes scapularis]